MGQGGLSQARLRTMHNTLAGYVESGRLPGLVSLVSRRGETHVDAIGTMSVGGGQPMRPDTLFRIASLTKPITGAALLMLVEECRLRLDDPVERWLPELADRRVLRRIDAPLDDTVPAKRSITVRDLATFTFGFGAVAAPPDTYPIQQAIRELAIGGDGPPRPDQWADEDEWLRRLASLPLLYQPGERWLYNTGADVLGVLIARASGQSFASFLSERLFEPLDMKHTGFHVPAGRLDRLPTVYGHDPRSGDLVVYDEPGGAWSAPPRLASGGSGLVSTADDLLAFHQMLLDRGRFGGQRLLSRPAVELMTSDQLLPHQRVAVEPFLDEHSGWGFCLSVRTRRANLAKVGSFGWAGGLGTTAYADPGEQLIGILLTQVLMDSPEPPRHFVDFETATYAAIDE